MSEIPTWNGIPVAGEVHGYIASPENVPHFYDADLPSAEAPGLFTLQVVAVGFDGAGNIPADPPPQYRSPLYHRQQVPVPDDGTHQPRAVFDGGFVTAEGWAAPGTEWTRSPGPGIRIPMSTESWCWVNLDGTIGAAPGSSTPTLSAYIAQVIAAVDMLKKASQK